MDNLKQVMSKLVQELIIPEKREEALVELSRNREAFTELAPILWHSVGTIAALLQEIVDVYPLLVPPTLSVTSSNRVCNVLALLQCVASHTETRSLFLAAHIPLFLYPFLNTISNSRPYEYLKLTSLGVIGALVKADDPEVINFLIHTEIIPLCLRIMDRGSELSKTVATFIIQKILSDENGLVYLCQTFDRLHTVCSVLNNMIDTMKETPSQRLLKHIVRCFLRISEHSKGRDFLRKYIPTSFKEPSQAMMMDENTRRWLTTTLYNLGMSAPIV